MIKRITPRISIKNTLPYSKNLTKNELEEVLFRIFTLISAVKKMIRDIPILIKTALKKPTKYIPKLIVKIKIVTVPGHGTKPAAKITPISLLWVLQPLQLQLGVFLWII